MVSAVMAEEPPGHHSVQPAEAELARLSVGGFAGLGTGSARPEGLE